MGGLIIKPTVILTPTISPVIAALNSFFVKFNKDAYVTSGLRDADIQLSIIQHYLIVNKLDLEYPDAMLRQIDAKMLFEGKDVYCWQPAWSKLLNLGVIINPPRDAECLMSYIRSGVEKKGQIIQTSPHMRGTAFDIGGGEDKSTSDELLVVHFAFTQGILGFINYLVEPRNNAIHCDCRKV